MNPKIQSGGRGRISFLLRQAFACAKAGDPWCATRFWDQAIAEGYEPSFRTKRQLFHEISRAKQTKPRSSPITVASG